jgi:hypothetical protein
MSPFDQVVPVVKSPPPEPAFVPTYEPVPVLTNAWGGHETLNGLYFASRETALYIMKRFGGLSIFEAPIDAAAGGGFTSTDWTMWHIRFPGGFDMNAGVLAGYFLRGPEKDFPGWAASGIRDAIKARAGR